MTKAKDIINQAIAWLGKKESDGSFKEIIDIYNSHKPLARGYKMKYTDEWCATFVSAVAIKCNATDIIPTECSCQRMIELFKNIGCFVEDENRVPNTGDIIFYDWQDDGKGNNTGWADHVGIVEKVSGSTITVIEGNYSWQVQRRTVQVNAKNIRGYAVPKYEKEVQEETKTEEVASGLKHKVGDTVSYTKIYSSSNSDTALNPLVKSGTITRVIEGRKHPYLINNGVGWIDDSCIGSGETKTEEVAAIKKGDKVKVLKNEKYDGGNFKAYYATYDVIQVKGDRAVIGIGTTVTTAINIKNIKRI